MLDTMTKPKRTSQQSPKQPPPNRTGKSLHVYIDPALRDAMELLVRQSRRSLTTEVEIALENHLSAAGLWPPPAPGDQKA